MNRTLALFLTLAILVAHTLAIHKDALDAIAPPYDEAHVAFRIARNFVQTGSLAWDHGSPPVESYSSLLWIAVAALGERLNFAVTAFCQTVGALSAMLAIFVLAQFSPGRLAGVIAPLLFVVSGGVAAAAGSGAETATLALLVGASYLAFERRAKLAFAACICLCVATRAEGIVFVLMLLALEIAGALRRPQQPRISLLRWFLPALVLLGLLMLLRHQLFGTWFSPFAHSWVEQSAQRWLTGAKYLGDFARGSGWTILMVFPLYYLVRGQLTGVGRRALLLAAGYAALLACMGGGHGPMFQPMVPMTALLLIAMQESMTIALDSKRAGWPQSTWAMFLVALACSALLSKYPGNLGLLQTEGLHRRWVVSSTPPRLSYQESLGRLGLVEEIEVTQRLRSLGIFMREHLDPLHHVLTPWPGSLGYLSRLRVIDALGRATLPPNAVQPRPWSGEQRADLLAVLARSPEYIVPAINWEPVPPTLKDVALSWSQTLDIAPSDERRLQALGEQLLAFELITVPVPLGNSTNPRAATQPFHLLRRRDLDLAPRLTVEVEGRAFKIKVQHRAHQQQVDLRVVLRDSSGRQWSLEPTGRVHEDATAMMRTSILLFPTGDRAIELAAGSWPADLDIVELRAVLRNPLARGEHHYSSVSEAVVVPLPR